MNEKKLEGELIFWKETYGFIRVATGEAVTTYFVHFKKCANLNSEQVPVIGARAWFNPAPPFVRGKAPEAVNVEFSELRPKNQNKAVVTEGGAR